MPEIQIAVKNKTPMNSGLPLIYRRENGPVNDKAAPLHHANAGALPSGTVRVL